jgi:hypothetical protein
MQHNKNNILYGKRCDRWIFFLYLCLMWVWNLVQFFRENKLQAFRRMDVFPILVSYVGVELGSLFRENNVYYRRLEEWMFFLYLCLMWV